MNHRHSIHVVQSSFWRCEAVEVSHLTMIQTIAQTMCRPYYIIITIFIAQRYTPGATQTIQAAVAITRPWFAVIKS